MRRDWKRWEEKGGWCNNSFDLIDEELEHSHCKCKSYCFLAECKRVLKCEKEVYMKSATTGGNEINMCILYKCTIRGVRWLGNQCNIKVWLFKRPNYAIVILVNDICKIWRQKNNLPDICRFKTCRYLGKLPQSAEIRRL